MQGRHNFVKEGIVAGVLGATAVAVWFFIVDLIGARPFFTPQVLGEGLLRILGTPRPLDSPALHVAIYTVFHYVAFCIVGAIVVAIVHQGHRTPGILAGLLMLFVALQLGALGITTMFVESPLGQLAWYQVFIANLLAAFAMGWWIWKKHPGVGRELRSALEGTDEYPGAGDTTQPTKPREMSGTAHAHDTGAADRGPNDSAGGGGAR
jgi:hypothetical protein